MSFNKVPNTLNFCVLGRTALQKYVTKSFITWECTKRSYHNRNIVEISKRVCSYGKERLGIDWLPVVQRYMQEIYRRFDEGKRYSAR